MIENVNKINNPLTIIAIFAALAEVNATISLGLIPETLQAQFIWFIITFPTLLVISFFITLNFNPKVMYAPSDYKNEENFLNTISGRYKVEQINVTNENIVDIEQILQSKNNNFFGKDEPKTNSNLMLKYGNKYFSELVTYFKINIENKIITSLMFSIHSDDLFLLSIDFNKARFSENFPTRQDYILRFTEENGNIIGEIAGTSLKSENHSALSRQTFELINERLMQNITN